MFIRRKGTKQDGRPVSREFILKGIVQSMDIIEFLLTDGRQVCVIEMYSQDPVMVNGETEHRFRVHVPNYHTSPKFNLDRMKFWLCYGHREPVALDEHGEPYVPLMDKDDCEYFTRRTLSFTCQVIQLEDGREIVELDYLPED